MCLVKTGNQITLRAPSYLLDFKLLFSCFIFIFIFLHLESLGSGLKVLLQRGSKH